MRASAPGLAAGWKNGIAIAAGETRTENLALVALGSMSGQVTSADSGAPISGAIVSATGETTSGNATTDALGFYTIPDLPSGTYTVSASSDGYRTTPPAIVSVIDGSGITCNFALAPGSVWYAYDELDRLIAAIDPGGAGAAYRYDAVGNVLSIARQSADTLSILGFSPRSGVAGSTVTITGTAFSSQPGGNTVGFNGSTATLGVSSSTQIRAVVPAGASSGPISVATADGTATSSGSFTVIASAAGPSVAGFTPPVATAGTPIAISGSNFDTSPGGTRVRQNVRFMSPQSVQNTAIEAIVPAGATSGHISVLTAQGSVSTAGALFVPQNPYTAADVGFTALTTIGETLAVQGNAEKIGLFAFDGMAGQRVAIRLRNSALKTLMDPYGHEMSGFGSFLGARTLPFDGTYTVVQHRCWAACDTPVDLSVFDVPPDVTAQLVVDGPPVTFDLTAPGQRARLLFNGVAGQHMAVTMAEGPAGVYLTPPLTIPSDRQIYPGTFGAGSPLDIVLSESGAYSLLLDGEFITGHYSIAVRAVQDVFVSVDVDGPSVTAPSDGGQDIYASFAGTAGTRVAFVVNDVTLPYWSFVTIRTPSGTPLLQFRVGTGSDPWGGFLEPGVLPETGLYTVFIDVATFTGEGSVTVRVITLPPDLPATIEIGGPPLTLTIPQAGQNAIVTFTGTANQLLTIGISGLTLEASMSLFAPGSPDALTSLYAFPMDEPAFEVVLPASGSYHFLVDPQGGSTGTITLSVASR